MNRLFSFGTFELTFDSLFRDLIFTEHMSTIWLLEWNNFTLIDRRQHCFAVTPLPTHTHITQIKKSGAMSMLSTALAKKVMRSVVSVRPSVSTLAFKATDL